jgi:hypothetical protein
MDQKDHIRVLQEQIDLIIGAESHLKRRKKTNEDVQREIFINTIPLIEHIVQRSTMLTMDYGITMVEYDDPYFQIIDSLIYLHFGKDAGELIMFYIYDRFNPDGTVNSLIDKDNNAVILEDVEDLWELVKNILNEDKKKK